MSEQAGTALLEAARAAFTHAVVVTAVISAVLAIAAIHREYLARDEGVLHEMEVPELPPRTTTTR